MLGSTNNNSRGNFTVVEGMEVHDITDNDLFRFFLNEDELSRSASEQQCPSPSCSFSCSCSSSSSPDSSQSGSISSPEPEFDSPPSSPSSPPSTSLPFVEVKTEKDTSNFLAPSLWPSSLTLPVLKEEPKDILQSFSFAGLDLSSPISLDMAVNALDQELKKRKNALSTKIDTTPSSKTTPASNNNSALSREDLLKLSTKSLDSYASTVNSNRSLTEDEERQLKRQRRLIKNRESAQLSRQRKRLYIEELEKKVTALSAENTELIKQVTLVTSENGSLKEENFQLQSFIKQLNETQKKNLACTAVPAVKVETVTESKNSSMKVDVTSSVTPSSPQTSHAESAATVVPSINISMEMEERAIEVIDKEVSHSPSPLYYYLEHPEELRKILGGANKKKGKKRKKDDNSSNSSASLSSQSNSSETEEISSAHIYFCPEAQELKTADKRNTRANSGKSLNGSVVSFLLPYSSVYPQKSACVPPSSSTDSTLVELSCQVLDTKTYPLSLPLKYERTYAAVSTSV